jgi:hypothetical protein
MPASAARSSTPINPTKEPAMTEAEFLDQQSRQARQAMAQVVKSMGKSLGHGVDPRAVLRKHPVITLGAAAATGFVAANLVVPSARNRMHRRLAAIERALRSVRHPSNGENGQPAKPGLVYRLLRLGFKAVRPVLYSALASVITDRQAEAQVNAATEDKSQPPQQVS